MAARNGSTVRLLGLLLAVEALVAACSTTGPGEPRASTAPPTASAALDDCVGAGQARLVAAGGIRPPVAGVVSLSAERTLHGADVATAAARLRVPVLLVTAREDPYGSADAAPDLYRALAHAPSRQLLVVGGDAHGEDLLSGGGGRRVQAAVLAFLRRHSH